MGPELTAAEARAVLVLNRDAILDLIKGCKTEEEGIKALMAGRWEAQSIHWVYERDGYFKREVQLEGIQESGIYRLNDSQARTILRTPLRVLLRIEHDVILRRWNELFFEEKARNK